MISYLGIEKIEVKKNKVRNENIDRIKLPCFCTYESEILGGRRLGLIVNQEFKFNGKCKQDECFYEIFDIGNQTPTYIGNRATIRDSLTELIEDFNINIVRAKIRVYEEV